MKLSLATAYPHLKLAIKAVLRRSAFAALLLAAPAHADLVAHLRFDGDLTHPLTVVAV